MTCRRTRCTSVEEERQLAESSDEAVFDEKSATELKESVAVFDEDIATVDGNMTLVRQHASEEVIIPDEEIAELFVLVDSMVREDELMLQSIV